MEFKQNVQGRSGESGNVLFLILIAVALFAALSYAVTQSTRSGAGDTNSETNLISSAQLTQYPAGVRTSVVRMIIGGNAVEELIFNDPSDFGVGGTVDTDTETARAVFHPNGGNATYQNPPRDVVTTTASTWHFNAEAQILNIGITDASDSVANDIVAWLPDVTSGICKRMNEELGITTSASGGIPIISGLASTVYENNMGLDAAGNAIAFPATGVVIEGDDEEFKGQPFGCFLDQAGGKNVYYHVIVER